MAILLLHLVRIVSHVVNRRWADGRQGHPGQSHERGDDEKPGRAEAQGVLSMCFSPDGQRLATASDDNTAKVWDARTGQELLALKGHTRAVLSVCFIIDSQRLATASDDNTAKVWDARTGQELLTLKGHTNMVRSVCFSP